MSANLPPSTDMRDFNGDFLSAYGVSGDSHAAVACLRTVWLAYTNEHERLAVADSLQDILSAKIPHTNHVVHLQRRL